ncbi:MAG: hypothetical protein IKT40_12590 [Bacilli bacterium]|nr:hypothetical protein [Bacilli bacterium]
MSKRLIRLTEDDLNAIIKESIDEILNLNIDDIIDIRKIPIEELRRCYIDYRLLANSSLYGKILYEPSYVNEAIGDILPADDIVNNIKTKYRLSDDMVVKLEHFHNIGVYVVVAVIGENVELIEKDMHKMGYFLSKYGNIVEIENMHYQVCQFEPHSQYQEDITDIIKNKYDILYHWTPFYNIDNIIENGLIPSHKNSKFNYPPRIYFMEGDSSDGDRMYLGRLLCSANNDSRNNGEYYLLGVNINNLDSDIRFYYDPNSEIGIYCEQSISSDNIEIIEKVKLRRDNIK